MAKIGSWLYVRNSKIDMFKGHMRLATDMWGMVEPVPAKDVPQNAAPVNMENNLSDTEYELVNVPA